MQNKTRQRRVAQRDVWLRARGLPCTRPITVQVAHKELVPWVPSCSLGRDSKVGLLQDLHVAQDWLRWNWYHLHDTGHGCSAHGLPTWVRAHTKGHHSTSQAGYRQYSVDCKQWISRWHRRTLCVFFSRVLGFDVRLFDFRFMFSHWNPIKSPFSKVNRNVFLHCKIYREFGTHRFVAEIPISSHCWSRQAARRLGSLATARRGPREILGDYPLVMSK